MFEMSPFKKIEWKLWSVVIKVVIKRVAMTATLWPENLITEHVDYIMGF